MVRLTSYIVIVARLLSTGSALFLIDRAGVAIALSPSLSVRTGRPAVRLGASPAEDALLETGLPPGAAAESVGAAAPRAAVGAESLTSAAGFDYGPLMESLRAGDFAVADQRTRDALIAVAGADAEKRGYVYWTEARALPDADLGTIENLWLHYSDAKFGYTVQKNAWRLSKAVFDKFCDRIGWTTDDELTGAKRKRRWFGDSEFIYTLQDAPKGHLPLTSALRGTQLLKALLQHPLWETDDWKRDL